MLSFFTKNSSLIFLFFTILIHYSISVSAKCHVDDESGLLAFKKGIVSDPSGMLSKWKSGTDCCAWPGIQCRDTNRVHELALYGQLDKPNGYLAGTISPTLAKLKELNAVYFQDLRNISGPFPSFLFSLQNIGYVYIENNKLSGKLPENLGQLSNLIALSLAGNRFSGPIPSSIGGLTQLIQLKLHNNLLTGTIPASFKALKNVTALSLDHNQLSGAIPDFFTETHKLIFLELSHNKLSGNIPGSIAAIAPNLRFLQLGHNALSGTIPDFLGKFQALDTLDLSWNKFSGTVPKTFGNLTKIFNLDLSHNSLVDPFPQMNVKGIESLDLSYNNFNLVNIPKWVASSPIIYSLKLAKCGLKFKLDDFKPVETYFYDYIDLSENEITGSPVKLLNRTDYLVGFYASGNQLKFDFGSLRIVKTLKDLDISRNLVFGKVPQDVAGLRMLNVSHNHLCGQLPATKFAATAFAGNDCLCGSPLPACKKT
ncbi:hypothetical protein LIER_13788 [Lithospermum erythrorhizon]|uniref:Leucine-rich repeat-containing N-terminal plant-type domain-containing protein n=1 Tax=Lithospermum erythrorhizon TaxID=34254 RepID=A0AAV3PZ76_LITER